AITIVTGILVDDAIVEIENIVRHMRMGKSAYRAALDAADEIGLAVIAITTTIIAVFAPVSFMGGIAGQYFKQFGLTVAFAVFFSLLVARLITPLLAAYFMRASAGHSNREGPLLRAYTRLLAWSVRHRFLTVALGLLIFTASIVSMQLLPSAFLPQEDNARIMLAVELPPGSKLSDMQRLTRQLTERIQSQPEVTSVLVNGGQILGSGSEVRKATLIIRLVPKDQRKRTQEEVKNAIARDLGRVPDIRYWFLIDNGQRSFQMVVTGQDGEAVNKAAAEITSQMKRLPMLALPVSTAELDRPELRVIPDSELASMMGVTTEAIAEAVRIATIGDVGPALA